MSIPRIRVAPVLIAIVLVSVACSDSESIDDGESSPTTTPTTTAADVPASAPSEAIPLGRSTHTIESAGLDREYIVIVPSSYDGSASMPLVFEFHGYSLWAEEQAAGSRLWTVGEREGFITVLPEGRGDIQRWLFELDDADIDISPDNPDMKLVTDLIAHLSTELEIDADRIYAAGFSNGGWMASALACTFPDVFAAIAPVAGILDFGDDCTDTPVPTVTFHGTADEYEPFVGGPEAVPARGELPTDLGGTYAELPINSNPLLEISVPDKVALRASRNGCAPDPVTSSLSDVTTVSTFTCPDGAAVVYHEVEGGTHWWGISERSGYDTNEVIWEFFASQ